MSRFDAYPRRELRRRRNAWLARNRSLVIASSVAVAVATSAIFATAFLLDTALGWYVAGAVQVAIGGAAFHSLSFAVLAHDAEAMHHLRGALGEENTRSELVRARRRRAIWGWVDSITLQRGDIDHVVVTRSGGLVAIDSKWRTSVRPEDNAEMARCARTMKLRTEAMTASLARRTRGSHRARGGSICVTPVVVLWGPAQHTVPDGAEIDGVAFVGGRQLLRWLRGLDGDHVSADSADELLTHLTEFRSTAWRANVDSAGRVAATARQPSTSPLHAPGA